MVTDIDEVSVKLCWRGVLGGNLPVLFRLLGGFNFRHYSPRIAMDTRRSPGSSKNTSPSLGRLTVRGVLGTAAVLAMSCVGLSAYAAPGDTSADTVVANVAVNSTITLNIAQSSFLLNGQPLTTVTSTGAVTGTVTTNNATGYSVAVQAAGSNLAPGTTGNADNIPIANLEVRAPGGYTPVSSTTPVVTQTKTTRSGLAGDSFSDDYRVAIPDVNSDTYSVTLNYVATALA